MRVSEFIGSVEGIRRKLHALAAVARDPAASEYERANAQALKARLEQQLRRAGAPAGNWTDNAFRLGRWARGFARTTSPSSPKGDWTDGAYRLGKALRRGYKKISG